LIARLVRSQAHGGALDAGNDVTVRMTDVQITRCTAETKSSNRYVSASPHRHNRRAHDRDLTYDPPSCLGNAMNS
jgi:hypothetical protein